MRWRGGRIGWHGNLQQGDIARKTPWQAARANREESPREREVEKQVEIEVTCALAEPVTTYLKFSFSWDINSLGLELKQ